MPGCVDREHGLLEHRADRGREGEPAVAQPVPVVGDGEPAGLLGQGLLALQGPELVGFGDLGGDHLEDPVREPAQRDRVVLGRAPDQVRLGVAAVLDRQRVHTLDDHRGLFFGDLPGGHRVPDRLVVVVQGVREVEASFGVAFGLPGGVGPVAAGVGGAVVRAEVEPVGVAGVAELELGDLVPQLRQGGQVGLGLGGREGPQPEVRDLVQQLGDGGDRGRDRVLSGVVECRCHTGNSGIRPPTVLVLEWGIPGSCGEVFRKASGAVDVVVSTSSTSGSGRSRQARPAGTRSPETALAPPPPPAVPEPGVDRHPAPYLSPSLRHFPPAPATALYWSRHSLAGARCSTTGGTPWSRQARPAGEPRLTSWCDPRGRVAGVRSRGSRRRGPRTCGARRARTGRGRRCAGRSRCLVPPGR